MSEFRRNIRPLFLETDLKTPGPYKTFYDVFGWFITQMTFSYIAAPFVLLGLADSIKVWGRLWYLVHIGTLVALVFFKSPATAMLNSMQKKRLAAAHVPEERFVRPELKTEDTGPMGLPEEMEDDFDEIVREVKQRRDSFFEERRKPNPASGMDKISEGAKTK